ncbi:unnamed protein product [Ilex paraguariensis]|uniref:2-oxoacid dehydrogenase acyltransferase catalytic domain-containing protein n=1 Tax=Ilex paraguariensis TaxID=185542 RepID=A0ABC8V1S9_9AQUA
MVPPPKSSGLTGGAADDKELLQTYQTWKGNNMKIKNKNCQNYMTVKRRLFDLSCELMWCGLPSGTFTLSNLGMFGVDHFDAILLPGTVSTFTLSNLGMFGVDHFDAILLPGTVSAIMAVGASQPSVVATKDGRIGMRSQMQVNLLFISTINHRVIYGSDLASFLQSLAQLIEDPKDLTL